MANAPARPTERTAAAPALDIAAIFAANQRGFDAAVEAQSHMLERLTRFNAECLQFFGRRLERDREAAQEFAVCKTPTEAIGVCGKFFEIAAKDYAEEMGLLAGIGVENAREAMEDVQHQVEDAMEPAEDAPTRTVAAA